MKMESFSKLDETVTALKPLVQGQTILGLIGDLGYGKTTLMSELLKNFGCQLTHSPTFSLVNKYQLDSRLWVYHIDLYRLKNAEEVDSSGFWDLFADDQAFFIIEWIDRIDVESLPLNFKKLLLTIQKNSDDSRIYKLQVL
jgi:tRNA threonylcarbamoyladenosine biosynthesis protein TsaE